MSAQTRGGLRGGRRLDAPLVGVLERNGRFIVAEPLFGSGPRAAVERGEAEVGELVLVGPGKRGARVLSVVNVMGNRMRNVQPRPGDDST